MEITGHGVHTIDKVTYGTPMERDSYLRYARDNANKIFSPISRHTQIDDSMGGSTNQIITMLNRLGYNTDRLFSKETVELPSRKNLLAVGFVRSQASWSGKVQIDHVTFPVVSDGSALFVNYSAVSTTSGVLPELPFISMFIALNSAHPHDTKVYTEYASQNGTQVTFPHDDGTDYEIYRYCKIGINYVRHGMIRKPKQSYKNDVAFTHQAGINVATEVKSQFNQSHSQRQVNQHDIRFYMSALPEAKAKTYLHHSSNNQKVFRTMHEDCASSGGFALDDTVTGRAILGDIRSNNVNNFTTNYAQGLERCAIKSIDHHYQNKITTAGMVEDGPSIPKQQHPAGRLVMSEIGLTNFSKDHTSITHTFGEQNRTTEARLSDKDKIMTVVPGDTRIVFDLTIFNFYHSNDFVNPWIPLTWDISMPFIGTDSIITGGDVTGGSGCISQVETSNSIVSALFDQNSHVQKEDIYKSNENIIPANVENSKIQINNFSLISGGIYMAVQCNNTSTHDTWLQNNVNSYYGKINVRPLIKRTYTRVGRLPTADNFHEDVKNFGHYLEGLVNTNNAARAVDIKSYLNTDEIEKLSNEDVQSLRYTEDPWHLSCYSIRDDYCGYDIIPRPYVDTVSIHFTGTQYMAAQHPQVLDLLSVGTNHVNNGLFPNILTIPFDKDSMGHDTAPHGPNVGRVSSISVGISLNDKTNLPTRTFATLRNTNITRTTDSSKGFYLM